MNQDIPSPTFAALDLGSNSFHLLIARFVNGRLEVIDKHKEMVRLASGLRKDGTLSQKAMNRALESLARFAERLRSVPNTHIHVVGTNTLRAADHSDDFLIRAEKVLGTPINVISGIEEARLVFRAVVHDLATTQKPRLVIDIGGGSTELIVGNTKPKLLESLYMGCVSYTNKFFPDGKISSKAYKKAVLSSQNEVQSVALSFSSGNWDEAVGTSGSIRATLNILEAMGLSPDHTITKAGLDELASKVCSFDDIASLNIEGLTDDRKPVFVGGLAVLHGLFNELNLEQLVVSDFAVREGLILDLAGMYEHSDIRTETVSWMQQRYGVDIHHAERISQLVRDLMFQVKSNFGDEYKQTLRRICWAAELHEIGLSVSHASHNQHAAYLLQHSDMAGFSRQEQKQLSFLVLNHRRKLRPMPKTYGFDPDWRLVQILRLACLLVRRRNDQAIPDDLNIKFTSNGFKVKLSQNWLDSHPLTFESLLAEQAYQAEQGLAFELKTS